MRYCKTVIRDLNRANGSSAMPTSSREDVATMCGSLNCIGQFRLDQLTGRIAQHTRVVSADWRMNHHINDLRHGKFKKARRLIHDFEIVLPRHTYDGYLFLCCQFESSIFKWQHGGSVFRNGTFRINSYTMAAINGVGRLLPSAKTSSHAFSIYRYIRGAKKFAEQGPMQQLAFAHEHKIVAE